MYVQDDSLEVSSALRTQLLNLCRASGADADQVMQALVDTVMISVIAGSATPDLAELNINHLCADMRANIRQAFVEYHAMHNAQRPRQ